MSETIIDEGVMEPVAETSIISGTVEVTMVPFASATDQDQAQTLPPASEFSQYWAQMIA